MPPNHANFLSAVLKLGEVYHQITEYRFFMGEEKPDIGSIYLASYLLIRF